MDILLNPNIAYLIVAFGLMVTVLAILSPGTGVLEAIALLILALVAWEMINLGVNWWAVAIIIIGIFFFILAVRQPKQIIFLIIAIIALVVGSAFLFPSSIPFIPAVNPFLALTVSILMTGFFWVATHKVLEARMAPPVQNIESIVGKIGEAKTDVQDEGTVLIGSELWSARSSTRILRGEKITVTGRDGFILEVAPVNKTVGQEDNP